MLYSFSLIIRDRSGFSNLLNNIFNVPGITIIHDLNRPFYVKENWINICTFNRYPLLSGLAYPVVCGVLCAKVRKFLEYTEIVLAAQRIGWR